MPYLRLGDIGLHLIETYKKLIVDDQLEPVMSASVTATSIKSLNIDIAGTPTQRHHLDQWAR